VRPKEAPIVTEKQKEFFKVELEKIIDKRHPLITLSRIVDWDILNQAF